MSGVTELLGNALNWRMAGMVIALVAMVLLIAYTLAKHQRKRRLRPGQYLLYESTGHTAAECRALLGKTDAQDIFDYRLEGAPNGGWYITFQQHKPTQQPLDTLFLLQFEGDNPARFSLSFKREAFGYREPVMPEQMIDDFFAAKVEATRVMEEEA